MEVMDCILTRRSVRKFVPNKPIPRETLIEIIKAAQYAPSAHNKQPWEFVVVEDKYNLEKISQAQQWMPFAKEASAVIAVCGNREKAFKDENRSWNFAEVDSALATQNLLLAAHANGLGATFCAAYPIPQIVEKVQDTLSLPKNIVPVALVVMGYPEGEIKQPYTRFHEDMIHWNQYKS